MVKMHSYTSEPTTRHIISSSKAFQNPTRTISSSTNDLDSCIPPSRPATPNSPPPPRHSESTGILVINTCAHRECIPFPRWAYCICSPTARYSTLISNDHEPQIPFRHRNRLTISLASIWRAVDLLWIDITERHPQYDNVSCIVIHTNSAAAAGLWPGVRSYNDESCLPRAVRRELQNQIRNDHGDMYGGGDPISCVLARRIERKIDLLEMEGVKVHVWFARKKETIEDVYEAVQAAREGSFVVEVWDKMQGFAEKFSAKYEGLKYAYHRKKLRSLEKSGDVY
ncbi:hypothetical protein DL98DRAFT_626446 [Cadophora sp. DSE1049]|nr:hypothetical protein DL98DRAFT_626446 [Cadophora sp. DSE1049]